MKENRNKTLPVAVANGNVEVYRVSENEIPRIIQNRIEAVSRAEQEMNNALKAAYSAEKLAKIEGDRQDLRFFHIASTGDVEALRKVAVQMGMSQVSTAKAVEACLQFTKVLSEASQYLFFLCTANMACTGSVVRQLKLQLEGASKEKLSEFARAEFLSVVRQLKQQEDVYTRQEALARLHGDLKTQVREGFAERDNAAKQQMAQTLEHCAQLQKDIAEVQRQSAKAVEENMKILSQRLDAGVDRDGTQDKRLDAGDIRDTEQDKRLDAGDIRDTEQDKRLDAGDIRDTEQDKRLDASEIRDVEHDKRLDAGDAHDKEQDSRLKSCEDRICLLEGELKTAETRLSKIEKSLDKEKCAVKQTGSGGLAFVALIVAVIALIVSCFL